MEDTDSVKVLGLPGRNPETEAWMAALLYMLGSNPVHVASYAHWRDGSEPDVAAEAARHPVGDADLCVAKSMGTMVLLASAAGGGVPGSAVLIGTPLKAYTDTQLEALHALIAQIPCLFIQQTDDFTGSCAALRELLGSDAAIEEMSGSDHVYADMDQLAELISAWREARIG
jgi:hypothetical protein